MKYDPASAEALLARTPAVLRTLLEGLPHSWLNAREGPETWSPREVVAHLADLEQDAWIGRARALLEHGTTRSLPGIDRERFRGRFPEAPLGSVLDEFERARAANLGALEGMRLTDRELEALGKHATQGEVRLSELLSAWVVHDLTHVAQITRALATQYREEVGPWIEYLSILRERGRVDGERKPGVGSLPW